MILKVYIRKHMFQLPRKQNDLTELLQDRFYKNKEMVKSAITKLYPISAVENENISVKKNSNIFLLNLYLLVLQELNELKIEEPTTLSDEFIINAMEEKTNLFLSGKTIEEIEPLVLNHLYPVPEPQTAEEDENTSETFKNVEYSINWIKKAHNELD